MRKRGLSVSGAQCLDSDGDGYGLGDNCPAFDCNEENNQAHNGCKADVAETKTVLSMDNGFCYDEMSQSLFTVNSDSMEINKYSWPGLTLQKTYSIPHPEPGPQVLGDCAVLDGGVYYANVGRDKIGKIKISNGELSPNHFSSPVGGPRSIAADGNSLWISRDDASLIYNVSTSGNVLKTVPNNYTVNECDGMVHSATGLWCSDLASGFMIKFSADDGALLAGPLSGMFNGLAFIQNQFWTLPDHSHSIQRLTPVNFDW